MTVPPDNEARLVARDLNATILLEAGAGTGKTTVLVDRLVECLLAGAAVDRVVAITFTEKAAGELRQRVRERLEERVVDDTSPAGERELLGAALAGLDAAPVSTIHAFAARLLRDHPVEAGVDPAFVQLDQTGSALDLEKQWRAWLDGLAGAPGGRTGAPQALFGEFLAAGAAVDGLRELARRRFAERYAVDPAPDPVPPDLATALGDARREAAALRGLAAACADAGDQLCGLCLGLADAVDDLDPRAGLHVAGAGARRVVGGKHWGKVGRKASWTDKDAVVALRERVRDALEAAAAAYDAYVAAVALRLADDFAAAAVHARRQSGLLDFDDLLGKARDLLRGEPGRQTAALAVRRALAERFDYLLVDEFQDTDPLQAEIVFFLAEREPRATAWSDVVLEPGKLFLVGDPKQSIYRFRRADIGMYHAVAAAIEAQGGRVVPLTHNFRTVAPLVDWVNGVFEQVIGGDETPGLQPGYHRLTAARPPQAEPAVVVLETGAGGHDAAGAGVAAQCTREAQAVAACVRDAVAAGVAPGDVALLLPVFTHVAYYERALRDAGVPYRVEGGRTYYARREVRDLVTVLRALSAPRDQVATFAALRTLAFAFSDDDLYEFSAAGGSFDCLAAQDEVWGSLDGHLALPLRDALACLRDLWSGCHLRAAWETLDDLVRRTSYLEALAAWAADPEQAIGNVDQLLAVASAFDAEPGASFHSFVRHVREQTTAADTAESPVGEAGDAVRILTVHKAKGLEFTVVVAADLAAAPRGPSRGDLFVDRRRRTIACALASEAGDAGGRRFATPGYDGVVADEAAAAAHEQRRLLYVALTRARDRLVVPVRSKESGLAALLAGHLDDVTRAREGGDGRGRRRAPAAPVPAGSRAAWVARREQVVAAASLPLAAGTPSGLEDLDADKERLDERAERAATLRRDRARAVGTAVHAVLERVPLDDPASLAALARGAAAREGVPGDADRVATLARACWLSAPVRAAAAGRHLRELAVAFSQGETLVEGSIDLAYRTDEGWVVVDFKTDAEAGADVLLRRYRLQAAAYAYALAAATGERVTQVALVAARLPDESGAAQVVTLPVDGPLLAELRARL